MINVIFRIELYKIILKYRIIISRSMRIIYCKLYGTIHNIFCNSQLAFSSHSRHHNSNTCQPSEILQILQFFSDEKQYGLFRVFLFHSPKFSKIFVAPLSCYSQYLSGIHNSMIFCVFHSIFKAELCY